VKQIDLPIVDARISWWLNFTVLKPLEYLDKTIVNLIGTIAKLWEISAVQ